MISPCLSNVGIFTLSLQHLIATGKREKKKEKKREITYDTRVIRKMGQLAVFVNSTQILTLGRQKWLN